MEETLNKQEEIPVEDKKPFRYFPFSNNTQPVFVLVIIGLIFYCNSILNENALDDGIIIHQNSYVLKGVRGIKGILTNDAYYSFYKRMNATDQLQGGRYRPLPVISFAIEQELIGRYRTGFYSQVEDLNRNGVLDHDAVSFTRTEKSRKIIISPNKKSVSETVTQTVNDVNYEYNNFVDHNGDGRAQPEECFTCWDQNRNFANDPDEDINNDGVFNEIDCQVSGSFFRHFNNVWTYILGCVLVYLLFRKYILKDDPDLAFLAALIFLTHPLHSEVVANIKSRDEIFCLIFIVLSFLYAFRFMSDRKNGSLVLSSLMFFLALLSKEFGILLLLLVPIALYVFHETKINIKGLLIPTLCFIMVAVLMIISDVRELYFGISPVWIFSAGVLLYVITGMLLFKKYFYENGPVALMTVFYLVGLVYLAMRLNAVNMAPGIPDTEILNNPYLLATGEEKFATKVFVLLKYLKLTLFPHPLISDYSYATIEYRNFTDQGFIFSLLIHLVLLITGIWLTIKRHVIGFAIITYLVMLLPVSNFIFDIGAIMLEANLFIPLTGISIIFAWLIIKGFDKITFLSHRVKKISLMIFILLVTVLYGIKTFERNRDWKNDVTLFLKDVKNSPHSVLVLGNAGARWIDLADTREITGIPLPGDKGKKFNDYNGNLKISEEEVRAGGYGSKREAALQKGIGYLKHAVELHPRYVNGFLNLGLAYYKLNKDFETIYYWKLAEKLYPDNPYLNNYYMVYSTQLRNRGSKYFNENKFELAVKEYKKWTIVLPADYEAWYNLGGAFFNLKQYHKARECWQTALALNPGDREIKEVLKTLELMKIEE